MLSNEAKKIGKEHKKDTFKINEASPTAIMERIAVYYNTSDEHIRHLSKEEIAIRIEEISYLRIILEGMGYHYALRMYDNQTCWDDLEMPYELNRTYYDTWHEVRGKLMDELKTITTKIKANAKN